MTDIQIARRSAVFRAAGRSAALSDLGVFERNGAVALKLFRGTVRMAAVHIVL